MYKQMCVCETNVVLTVQITELISTEQLSEEELSLFEVFNVNCLDTMKTQTDSVQNWATGPGEEDFLGLYLCSCQISIITKTKICKHLIY